MIHSVSHFWAHTVRKLLPASCVDCAARTDMTPHISGACREMIICWRRWLICWGSESSNMKGVLCKQTPVKTNSLTTSEMNHSSVEYRAESGGDSPSSSHLERKLQGKFLPPEQLDFTAKIKKRNYESLKNICLLRKNGQICQSMSLID